MKTKLIAFILGSIFILILIATVGLVEGGSYKGLLITFPLLLTLALVCNRLDKYMGD